MASELDQIQPAKKPRLATNEGEEKQDQDFISCLPDEILHTILSKLLIRDAAATTAVSKRWAPLFPTLPFLKIDADSFNPWEPKLEPDRYNKYVENRSDWLDALFSVLDSRQTPIKRFDIAVDIFEPDEDEFYQVFRTLCVAGVKELSIDDTDCDCCYRIPSPVFACNSIVKLEIDSCKLVVPSKLTGLRSVKSLVLSRVRVTDDHLRRMISRCKAMEKLVITDCLKVENIVIHAPSLSELVISQCRPVGIVLKSVPRLISVSVSFGYSFVVWKNCYASPKERGIGDDGTIEDFSLSDSDETFKGTNESKNLVAFLNRLHGVKDLHLEFFSEYRKILLKEGMPIPTRLSPKCSLVNLKKLCLCVPLYYHTFNGIISCLLNSSPRLVEIIICFDACHGFVHSSNDHELDIWEKQSPAECVKLHLTTATFYLDDYLSADCFVIPQFLLLNAGNLKNMNIFYKEKAETILEAAERINNELFAIQAASPDVEITSKPIISRYQYLPSF